jgi:hypothetical protein
MDRQLQQTSKLSLDLCMTTSKFSEMGPVNLPTNKSEPARKYVLPLAAALQDEVDRSDLRSIDKLSDLLKLADLKVGKNWLEIQHSNYGRDRHKPYYSTNITNRSTEKIRIDRFATYARKGDSLVLYSITGGFFSDQQFREWYELGNSNWIEPSQVVTDPNNHSNLGVYWIYFGSTASSQQFVAGSLWNGKPWWQLF